MNSIVPTIGRIVNFVGNDGAIRAAIVTYVHNNACINLRAFGHDSSDTEDGIHTSVSHADSDSWPAPHGTAPRHSWHWMPYQKGQAAKTEKVESDLVEAKRMASAGEPLVRPA